MEQIIITVSPFAQVTVEVKGHPGSGCKAVSEEIEKALGETTNDEKTREFDQSVRQSVHIKHNS